MDRLPKCMSVKERDVRMVLLWKSASARDHSSSSSSFRSAISLENVLSARGLLIIFRATNDGSFWKTRSMREGERHSAALYGMWPSSISLTFAVVGGVAKQMNLKEPILGTE